MSADWMSSAACRNSGVDFFPVLRGRIGQNITPAMEADFERKVAEAVALCETCPVLAECHEFARNEKEGIWAGVFREPAFQKRRQVKAAAARARRIRERESA